MTDYASLFDLPPMQVDYMAQPRSLQRTELDQGLANLDPNLESASEVEMDRVAVDLSDFDRLNEANRAVDQGVLDLPLLGKLRAETGQVQPDRAMAGAVAASLDPDEVSPAADSRVFTSEKQKAAQYAMERMHEVYAEFKNTEKLDNGSKTNFLQRLVRAQWELGGKVTNWFLPESMEVDVSKVGGVAADMVPLLEDIAPSVVAGLSHKAAERAYKRVFPELNEPEYEEYDDQSPVSGERVRRTRERSIMDRGNALVLRSPDWQAKVDALISAVKEESEKTWIAGGTDANEHSATFFLLDGLSEVAKSPNASPENDGKKILAMLEYMPFISAGKFGVKSLIQAANGIHGASAGVGLVKGTYKWAAATTKAGYTHMANAIRSRAPNTPLQAVQQANDLADLVQSIAIPRMGPRVTDPLVTDTPYIQTAIVDPIQRDKLANDPAFFFGGLPVAKINNFVPELLDGGASMTAYFGGRNGTPYRTATSARGANTRTFGGQGTVVPGPGGNGFLIEMKNQKQWGLTDVGGTFTPDLATHRGYGVWSMFGKSASGTTYGITGSNVAERQTERVFAAFGRLIEPYTSLPAGSQVKMAEALDKIDDVKNIDFAELRRMGLNDHEILGVASVRRAAEIQRGLTNARLHAKYTAGGWRGLVTPSGSTIGVRILRDSDEAVHLEGDGRAASSIKGKLLSGKVMTLDQVPANWSIARIMSPGQDGIKYHVLTQAQASQVTSLPLDILGSDVGYLPRPYKYWAYVKEMQEGRAVRTLMPARSQVEGESLLADLQAQHPNMKLELVKARELRADVFDADELDALDEAGLLWGSHRGPSRLKDASGDIRMPTVEDRIRMMVRDAGMDAGLQRWGDAMKRAWNAKYNGIFRQPFTPAMRGSALSPLGKAQSEELIARARHEHDFINNMLGHGPAWMDGWFRAVGSHIGSSFYNMGTRIERLTGSKRTFVSDVMRGVGDEFVGHSGRFLANSRTLPYLVYIASNPQRQLPLQMTNIPAYFAVNGGPTYLLGGGFSRDFSILTAAGLVDGGSKLAGKLGSDPDLVLQFRRASIGDSLEHHTMVAAIANSGVTSRAGRFNNALQHTTDALTKVGVGAGIRADKVAAWLIIRNRWKAMNPGKKATVVDEQEWVAQAQDLNLNPGMSDNLPFSKGVLGVMTQFLSMQVKQMGRTFQALPGVGTGGTLTKAEYQRMVGMNALLWGVEGYGAYAAADYVLNSPELGDKLDESTWGETKQLLREVIATGINNTLLDGLLSIATGKEEDTAFSMSFSPNGQWGGTAELAKKAAYMLGVSSTDTLRDIRWQAPALGMVSDTYKAMQFAAGVLGAPPLPTPETDDIKRAVIVEKVARIFPAVNNFYKSQAALEMGKSYDSQGAALADTTRGAAAMKMVGVRDRNELAVYSMQRLMETSKLLPNEEKESVKDEAFQTATWMLPLIDAWLGDEMTLAQVSDYIDTVAQFHQMATPEAYRSDFDGALRTYVHQRLGESKMARIIDKATHEYGSSRFPGNQDNMDDILQRIPDAATRQDIKERLMLRLVGDE